MKPPISPADPPALVLELLKPKFWTICRGAGSVARLLRPSQPGSASNVSVFSNNAWPWVDWARAEIIHASASRTDADTDRKLLLDAPQFILWPFSFECNRTRRPKRKEKAAGPPLVCRLIAISQSCDPGPIGCQRCSVEEWHTETFWCR